MVYKILRFEVQYVNTQLGHVTPRHGFTSHIDEPKEPPAKREEA